MKRSILKKMMNRFAHSEAGASLVEFAILAPVFIFMFVGIVEIGRYTYYAILLSNAARAGVQYGAQNTATLQDVSGMASAAAADAMSIPQMSASPSYYCENTSTNTVVSCPAAGPTPPDFYYVKVVTTGTFTSLLHYPGIPNNVPISGSAVMRVVNTSE
jgi:Flp pilus assembly protein TadG